ncbi:hypothetical protein GCM10028803_14640 [Larkinella knui]
MTSRAIPVKNTSEFSYDAQGRLHSILTYALPDSTVAPAETSVYTYDGQNRLTQMRRDIRRATTPGLYEIYTYTYNGAGQLSKLDYANNLGDGDNVWAVTLQYSPLNQLASSHKSFATGGVSYTDYSVYTFTGKNLTELVSTRTLTRNVPSTNTITTDFTFDTKTNPFYGVYIIPSPFVNGFSNPHSGNLDYYTYYGGIDNVFNLSRNNVLTSVASNRTITYAYTYVGDLPATRIKTEPNSPQETLTYAYETY